MNRRSFALALVLLVALFGVAVARPGGGDSYSGGGGHGGGGGYGGGGGSSSSGGGGGGDIGAIFELIYWTVRLCIEFPYIGLPLVGGIGLWLAYSAWKQHRNKDWDSGPPAVRRSVEITAIREVDPHFSTIVFEDFAFRLFSAAHRARGSAESLATVAPYVSVGARDELNARKPVAPMTQVIVGAMRVVDTNVTPERVSVVLELEANLATADATHFTVENWTFARDASVRTKPPSASRTLACPNCGAPWQATSTGTQQCASCRQVVDNGRFDWVVEHVELVSSSKRGPTLTTEVPERGTDLPTYKHRKLDARFRSLQERDPQVDERALQQRVELIHRDISAAWSKNDLAPVRGLVSDGLYDYLDYWVQAYKQQGLRNVMSQARVTKIELAKVMSDRWYDAVTIRVWATGKDYVVHDATGKVVRGSKLRERPYSEYWTLIRSTGRQGPVKSDRTCGNCGAPLKVSMAGACEYCNAHVTAGEFDWVLSKIEQDDSYRG